MSDNQVLHTERAVNSLTILQREQLIVCLSVSNTVRLLTALCLQYCQDY
jgi:hypothetical protein